MKKLLVLIAIFSLVMIGCGKDDKANTPDGTTVTTDGKLKGEVRIAGGTAHIPIWEKVAEVLKKENPDLKITIQAGGSGAGIKQAGEGLVDIGNSGRDLKESEIKDFGLVPYKIAIDGIAVIVNPKSGVENLTLEQVQKIFAGEIKKWSEVGGADEDINIYTRGPESGTRKTFESLALKGSKIAESANLATSNGNMKVLAAGDEQAIGYMSVGYLDDTVKPLSVDGVAPTLENVKSGAYKIQRFLYSCTKGEAKGLAKVLIDYVQSEEGQKIVVEKGFLTP